MIGHRTASRRTLRYVVIPGLAFAATAGLLWRASYATFDPGATRSGGASGQVTLSDDDRGRATFTPNGPVAPGSSGTQCIQVTSDAGDAGSVRMYLTGLVQTVHGFDDHLMITVVQGDGGGFGNCAGFTPDGVGTIIPRQSFAEAAERYADFGSGAGTWATHGNTTGEAKSYQVTWDFDTTGMSRHEIDALMGESTDLGFQWELQNV